MKKVKTLILLNIVFISIFVIFSCEKKESLPCYECVTTIIFITDPPLPDYPDTTKIYNELCNKSEKQIDIYERSNVGSNDLFIPSMIYPSGIRITQLYTTKCNIKSDMTTPAHLMGPRHLDRFIMTPNTRPYRDIIVNLVGTAITNVKDENRIKLAINQKKQNENIISK